ncbi:MAG: hypothetical protein KGD67_12115, partial [Candidatus Lokiarchaeota archaeon]|nr:hypothetical protein [Candidatus Lokiarchaeota archaeon]
KIYDGTIESNGIDNANNNIISNGSFNLAILRIVGISNGVDLKLNGLISIEELPNTIKNFLTRAKKVYLDKIKEFKAEGVLKENDL